MKLKIYPAYYVCIMVFSSLILFGFLMDSPINIFRGIIKIILNSDILITDYIEVGGIGAAFVNSGLLSIISIFILIYIGIKPNGSTIMSLWLMAGFAFFGKNLLNVWPVIIGVWLYSKAQKEPFLNYILIALLGTALSPAVSQVSFIGKFSVLGGLIIGIIIGIAVGFILPPLAAYCIKLHQGYNLYNIGFAAGLLGTIVMSILRALGINFSKRLIWNTGNTPLFLIFLIFIFSMLILVGYILNGKSFKGNRDILQHSGRLVSDYYFLYGNAAFINMGILGIIFSVFVFIAGADLNGPTIGAIFTIVGFGAFGKHPLNVTPILVGALLSTFLNIWVLDSPEMILSCLFSTTLAPIAGQFGWGYGVLAGFLHVCTVMNTGYLHGGLNLYNNGLAGGLVAVFLVPIITAFRKDAKE